MVTLLIGWIRTAMLVLSCMVVLGLVIPVLFRGTGVGKSSRVIIGEAELRNSSLVAWGDGDLGSWTGNSRVASGPAIEAGHSPWNCF